MYQVEQGQQYERDGEVYEVVYENDEVVLLQYGPENHRLEDRQYFGHCIEEGYFDPQQVVPEVEEEEVSENNVETPEAIPHEKISWLGEKGAESLRREGITSARDIQRVSDDRLLECNSVGETAVENMREWAEENE